VLNRTTGGTTRYDANYYYSDNGGALWDHTGNPLKRTEDWGSGLWTTTLRYDNVYRLTEETRRDSGGGLDYTHLYIYDAVGNRTLRNDGGSLSLGHAYDANNKLTITRWVGGGPPGPITANFYYDGAGNMTSVTGSEFGAWTMAYDDAGRLTSVASPAGTESFVYNALGQRMQLTAGGAVTKYVYDGDRVLEETDNAGAVLARYTTAAGSYYAPLLHLWRVTGESRFPMYDLTGSVRGLVDAGGAVTDTYSLELFGKQRASTGSTPNPYRFGGAWGYINGGSGLQQLGARFYWPEIGRFVQQDPLHLPGNRYVYTWDNPLVWVDPAGWWGVGVGASATAGVGVVAGAAGTVGVGGGWFSGGGWGGFAGGGGFAGAPGHAVTVPQNGWPYPFAVGAYAGLGGNLWFSPNAKKPSDLAGISHSLSINAGVPFAPWLRLSVGVSWSDQGILVITVGPPFAGLGAGFGVFQHDTCTLTWGR
jgi:RHS repeat-associated protein